MKLVSLIGQAGAKEVWKRCMEGVKETDGKSTYNTFLSRMISARRSLDCPIPVVEPRTAGMLDNIISPPSNRRLGKTPALVTYLVHELQLSVTRHCIQRRNPSRYSLVEFKLSCCSYSRCCTHSLCFAISRGAGKREARSLSEPSIQ
jgi:hypothetical protein